jgi:hypothetical protein
MEQEETRGATVPVLPRTERIGSWRFWRLGGGVREREEQARREDQRRSWSFRRVCVPKLELGNEKKGGGSHRNRIGSLRFWRLGVGVGTRRTSEGGKTEGEAKASGRFAFPSWSLGTRKKGAM